VECWCGNNPKYPSSGPTTGCTAPCPGNSNQICGGSGTLMSLYQLYCSTGPVPPPTGGSPVVPPPGSPPVAHAPPPPPHTSVPGHGGGTTGVDIGGWIFFSLLLGGVFFYFLIGALVLTFVLKKEGTERVPHFTFWKEVPFLIKDGALFIKDGALTLVAKVRGGGDPAYTAH